MPSIEDSLESLDKGTRGENKLQNNWNNEIAELYIKAQKKQAMLSYEQRVEREITA